MTAYTDAQFNAMSTALALDNATGATSAQITTALNSYYSAQTSVRGYAALALNVPNNAGDGKVANQEMENAVGKATWTPAYQAQLALALANADIAVIGANGHLVPPLAGDATIHATVFANPNLSIPITAWGGMAFTVLGQNWTLGLATPAETAIITAPQFNAMSAADVSTKMTQ